MCIPFSKYIFLVSFYIIFILKLFPAFNTRFFCSEKEQKRAQTDVSIRAKLIYFRELFQKANRSFIYNQKKHFISNFKLQTSNFQPQTTYS
tara:strand:- start:1575 stop:1847 length:273 start_codon:yes stop_codon:yes gene_type:complete